MRKDIQMSSGKLAAQAGHAFGDALHESEKINKNAVLNYRNESKGGSKVMLAAKKESDLIKAYIQLKELNIPCSIVVDRNHIHLPDFDGSPVITGLGVGPCTKNESKQVLKKFQVYK